MQNRAARCDSQACSNVNGERNRKTVATRYQRFPRRSCARPQAALTLGLGPRLQTGLLVASSRSNRAILFGRRFTFGRWLRRCLGIEHASEQRPLDLMACELVVRLADPGGNDQRSIQGQRIFPSRLEFDLLLLRGKAQHPAPQAANATATRSSNARASAKSGANLRFFARVDKVVGVRMRHPRTPNHKNGS